VRDANFWFRCAQYFDFAPELFNDPDGFIRFLTETIKVVNDVSEEEREILGIFGEIFISALYHETTDEPFEPVIQFFEIMQPYRNFFGIAIVAVDKASGLCLTLDPQNHKVAQYIDTSQINSLEDLNEALECVLEHMRLVYQSFQGK